MSNLISSRFFGSNPDSTAMLTDKELKELTDTQLQCLINDYDNLLSKWQKNKFRKNKKIQQRQLAYLRATGDTLVQVLRAFGNDAQAMRIATMLQKQLNFKQENQDQNIKILLQPSGATTIRESDILTKMRSWNDYFNLIRLVFVFVRGSTSSLLKLGEDTKLVKNPVTNVFDKVKIPGFLASIDNDHAGIKVTPKDLLNFFEKTELATDALSVALFLLSLILTIIKATLQALADSEEAQKMDAQKRAHHAFSQESIKIFNDLFWAWVNFITNYGKRLFELSDYNVNILLCLALIVDVGLTLLCWYKNKNAFNAMLIAYQTDLSLVVDPNDPVIHAITNNMSKLMIQWEAKEDTSMYSVTAAVLLVLAATIPMIAPHILLAAGVATTVLFPLIMPSINMICGMLCQLAVCLYLTTGDFHTMRAKKRELDWHENAKTMDFNSLMLKWEQKPPANSPTDPLAPITREDLAKNQEFRLLEKEYIFARNLFILKLSLYFVAPLVAIGLSTVCWMAAAVLGPLLFTLAKKVVEYVEESQRKELEEMRHDFEIVLENTAGLEELKEAMSPEALGIEQRIIVQ